jgi:acetoin utilization protein AcuB
MGHLPGNAVARLMTTSVVGLPPTATVKDAHVFLKQHALRYVPVLSQTGGETPRLLGLLSDRDVLRALRWGPEGQELDSNDPRDIDRPVAQLMAEDLVTIAPEDLVAEAAQLLIDRRTDAVAVVSGPDKALVGVLSAKELLSRLTVRPTSLQAGTAASVLGPAHPTLDANQTVRDAILLMRKERLRHLAIVDPAQDLLGLVSDRDLLRALPPLSSLPPKDGQDDPRLHCDERDAETQGVLSQPIASIMRTDVMTAEPHTPTSILAELMVRYRFSCVPILASRRGNLEGLVTQADLLRLIIRLARTI